MNTLEAVAKGIRIFALLSNIPPGQQTVIPRAMLEGAMVPGNIKHQTPEFLIAFFHKKLKFGHTLSYDGKNEAWTFLRWPENKDLQ